MKFLITGGCGFLGTNLAHRIIKDGNQLILFDNLSRQGSMENLQWLKERGELTFIHGDIRSPHDVENLIAKEKPDALFHLAGQVAMTTSVADPRKDFEINVLGTINVLEALRKENKDCPLIYSSSNKVYGDFSHISIVESENRYFAPEAPAGFDESLPLSFHTPYGCSKGAADQYVLDYSRIHGLNSTVFRHSTMYGTLQHATFDQGWIGWFCQKALEKKEKPHSDPFTISGTGKQVRDILFADDAVDCYMKAVENIALCKGEAFNIGGGMNNSLSLLELFSFLEGELSIELTYKQLPWRSNDQKIFVCNNAKATKMFGWQPKTNSHEGVKKLLHWLAEKTTTEVRA